MSETIPIKEPEETIADKYMDILLNQPVFNWESTNMIKEWKHFCGQVHKIYKYELTFPKGKDKNKVEDVLNIFEAYFTLLQSMIHSWYNLGALQSHQCKDESDFMSCLCALTKDCGFTNENGVVKCLCLIHNNHKHVQDQLLKEITKDSTITDCLQTAWQVKAIIQSEKLAQMIHSNQSDNVSIDAFKKTKSG